MDSHTAGVTHHTQTHFTHQHADVRWKNSQIHLRPNVSSEQTDMAEAMVIDCEIYLTEKKNKTKMSSTSTGLSDAS